MRKTAQLIEQLIETGKKNGLRAGDIASQAGISSPNLSRIRKTGRFNADTLERLLAVVGGEIHVTSLPERQKSSLSMIAAKLNAGRREQISTNELHKLLTKFRPSVSAERAFSHLVGVVEELPVEQVHDLVIHGSATLPALKRIVEYVDGEGPTVDWIYEQNSFTNAVA